MSFVSKVETKYRIIIALKKIIVCADFKTMEKKFQNQGVEKDSIKRYFEIFKKLRDKNQLKEPEKNIDYWNKKEWTEFTSFLDKFHNVPTKTQIRKETWKLPATPEGAEKVGENSHWVVYKVEEWKAIKTLGTRNWCIVRDKDTAEEYLKKDDYYIALSKDRSYKIKDVSDTVIYEDPLHKIAVQHMLNGKDYWDAHNKNFENPPPYFPKCIKKEWSEKKQIDLVTSVSDGIKFIQNPSENVQLEAVKKYGYAIKYIIEKGIVPSEDVQLTAVKQDGNAIQYIKKPSENVQMESIKQTADAYACMVRHNILPSKKVTELYHKLYR